MIETTNEWEKKKAKADDLRFLCSSSWQEVKVTR